MIFLGDAGKSPLRGEETGEFSDPPSDILRICSILHHPLSGVTKRNQPPLYRVAQNVPFDAFVHLSLLKGTDFLESVPQFGTSSKRWIILDCTTFGFDRIFLLQTENTSSRLEQFLTVHFWIACGVVAPSAAAVNNI
jgi:hypothetical protein